MGERVGNKHAVAVQVDPHDDAGAASGRSPHGRRAPPASWPYTFAARWLAFTICATICLVVLKYMACLSFQFFSVHLTGYDGIGGPGPVAAVLSPEFNLTLHLRNTCIDRADLTVLYSGVVLGWATMEPRDCAGKRWDKALEVAARGEGVGLSDQLRDRLSSEWSNGTMELDVDVRLFRGKRPGGIDSGIDSGSVQSSSPTCHGSNSATTSPTRHTPHLPRATHAPRRLARTDQLKLDPTRHTPRPRLIKDPSPQPLPTLASPPPRERAQHANGTLPSSPLRSALSDGVPHHHHLLTGRAPGGHHRRRGLVHIPTRRLEAAAPRGRRCALARHRGHRRGAGGPTRPAHPPRPRPPRCHAGRLRRLRPRHHEASGSDWGGAGHGGVRGSRRAGVHRARTTSASKAHGAQGLAPRYRYEVPRAIWTGITFNEKIHGQIVQCYGLIYGKQVGTWHISSVQYSCCCIHLLAEVTRPQK